MKKTIKLSYILAIIATTYIMLSASYGWAWNGATNHQKDTYNTNPNVMGFVFSINRGYYQYSYGYRYNRHGHYRHIRRHHYPGHRYGNRHYYSRHKYGHMKRHYRHKSRHHYYAKKKHR